MAERVPGTDETRVRFAASAPCGSEVLVATHPALTRRVEDSSSSAPTKVCPVSSDGRAPVLQTGSRRLEPSTGYQIWARSDNGSTPVLQTGSGDSTSPASTRLSGHGSVAESDIASVETRVRFPLTAPSFAAVAQWLSNCSFCTVGSCFLLGRGGHIADE